MNEPQGKPRGIVRSHKVLQSGTTPISPQAAGYVPSARIRIFRWKKIFWRYRKPKNQTKVFAIPPVFQSYIRAFLYRANSLCPQKAGRPGNAAKARRICALLSARLRFLRSWRS